MTGIKKYEHFDEPQEGTEPVISGSGMEGQKYLLGTVNKWVRLTRKDNESDKEYQERVRIDSSKILSFRSHLLVSKGFDAGTSRVTAVVSNPSCIGYSWMPVTGKCLLPLNFAKGLCIWFNSTIGRCLLRTVGGRKPAYPMFNPASWHDLPLPNIENQKVIDVLEKCYNNTSNIEVPSFRDGRVAVRELWDDAVSEALEIDRSLIADMANRLAVDPYVSKSAFFNTL